MYPLYCLKRPALVPQVFSNDAICVRPRSVVAKLCYSVANVPLPTVELLKAEFSSSSPLETNRSRLENVQLSHFCSAHSDLRLPEPLRKHRRG